MKKILIIEDDPTLQKTLTNFLKEFKVFSAFDGLTGIELAKKEKPDLIMLDLIIPRMEGLSVLKKLKEEKETEVIPVIILTNLEDPVRVEGAIQAGAVAYLIKNQYSLKELLKKIKENIR